MKITKIDLSTSKLPDNLERALDRADDWIGRGVEGILTRDQMAEAIELSDFLPFDTHTPLIIKYLDRNESDAPSGEPAFYQLVPKRQDARMSACGPKSFEQFTLTNFVSPLKGAKIAKAATLAYLWLINSTFHVHGNDRCDINQGWTYEDYEVHPSGGSGFYVMGDSVFYVEPDKDPENGTVGWTIPPGMLHGVLSEDLENPALAVLRFQRQGLATRKDTENPAGWGWPRDEEVYGYASDAIIAMHDIAQGRAHIMDLPPEFVGNVSRKYAIPTCETV